MLVKSISPPLRARSHPPLPVGDMVLGQPPEAAAGLLPRLFNLCRTAQAIAARAAFGLPQQDGWQEALRREILKEHVLKLCLKWPGHFSRPAICLPRDWYQNEDALRGLLFGSLDMMPATPAAFDQFLMSGAEVAQLLKSILLMFPAGQGVRQPLPITTPGSIFDATLQENSVAARHADHPVMQDIERAFGRGPLWSAAGVAYDAEACLNGDLPCVDLTPRRAVVPAARGFYGITATVENGSITRFQRITPTDQLLASGGALAQSLASLPSERAEPLGQLLLSILDPCFPVVLERAQEEEAMHA